MVVGAVRVSAVGGGDESVGPANVDDGSEALGGSAEGDVSVVEPAVRVLESLTGY
jgi:hypothetical protein